MPLGFGKCPIKSKGRTLSVKARFKRSVDEVKAKENCLDNALIIGIAKAENYPNYKAYRQGRNLCPVVSNLLDTSGIDLYGGVGTPNLIISNYIFGTIK